MWLYTEKLGKITCIAKGAKKNRSKYFSNTMQFCYGNYVIYKGRNLFNISEAEIIDSFQDFLKDLDTLTYCSYLCELIDICVQEKESNRYLFKELMVSFYLIKTNAIDIEVLTRAFEVKLLRATGYELNLDRCSFCGKKINKSNYINFQYLSGICDECEKINGVYINLETYNVLKYLLKMPLEKLHRLSISKNTKKELFKILSMIISQNYMKKPKSLQMLNFMKED
ncbi:DNA repair protein RecO [Clostridium oceanicum]|uniref:DNA repair protein RecO n=1 Tax=Clostridium oceanicum TaxID=1543 RepID=A0ABN1JV45_9CLOT